METTTASKTPAMVDEWTGIRYVFYVTLGWLVGTALAVVLLMTVVPGLI